MVSEFERFAVQAIIKFYDRDYDMFLENLDENVIWYGPKKGQYIVGKENLRKSLVRDKSMAKKFRIENVVTKLISYTPNVYSLLVTYRLYSYFADNTVTEHIQHVLLNGQRCKDKNGIVFWRCPFIHVSNVMSGEKSAEFHWGSTESDSLRLSMMSDDNSQLKRLVLPGDNCTSIYIKENAIRYIVGGKGIMCYVHTDSETHLVRRLLKDVQALLPDYYYRCHSSYIVNLRHVLYLSSHKITLDDMTEIPISVKRYSEIKKYIDAWMTKAL